MTQHQIPGPGSVVVIGLQQVYDQLVELTRMVRDLSGRLDRADGQHKAVEELGRDHEARLRSLERSRWPLPSLAVMLSVAALVLTYLHGG